MTEVLDPPLTGPVGGGVDALSGVLDGLVAATGADGSAGELWQLGSGELLELTAAVHTLLSRGEAVLHALVREVDVRGAGVAAGAASTAGWLATRCRLHPAGARRLVRTARALHDEGAGPLVRHAGEPEESPGSDDGDGGGGDGEAGRLRAAFAAGQLSAEHAAVATQTLEAVRRLADAGVVEAAERFLVEQARLHHPKALGHLGRHLRHVLDPDAGERLAEAERREAATQELHIRDRAGGGSRVSGRLDAETTAALRAALAPLAAPRPAADGAKDPRSVGRRQADALAELLRRYAGSEAAPAGRHGARATVTVTMTLDTLQARLGAAGAWLDWAGPISAEAARRLACDANLIPVVLGANGEPLDVGRSSYPVTAAIWRGLVARDRGCAFAGCDRPPEWCDAHHLKFWADGGITAVGNMCLLCSAHHDAVHHHGWRLELRDGRIWTIPPPWIDPTGSPRRNTGRDLHTDVHDLLPDDMITRQHGGPDGDSRVTDQDTGTDPRGDP